MNISYNWLKRYLKTDLSAEEMATILTDIGLEVESFEKIESIRARMQRTRDRKSTRLNSSHSV